MIGDMHRVKVCCHHWKENKCIFLFNFVIFGTSFLPQWKFLEIDLMYPGIYFIYVELQFYPKKEKDLS